MDNEPTLQDLINGDTPLLLDFFATWCGPCKTMDPVLQELANEMGEKINIIKIDVDEQTDLAVQMKVMGVPTFMVFKQGQLKWAQPGVLSKNTLKEALEPFI